MSIESKPCAKAAPFNKSSPRSAQLQPYNYVEALFIFPGRQYQQAVFQLCPGFPPFTHRITLYLALYTPSILQAHLHLIHIILIIKYSWRQDNNFEAVTLQIANVNNGGVQD